MGIDLNVGGFSYLGERYAVLDCPGSVEFCQETKAVLPMVDAAIIVVEPDLHRLVALSPLFHELEAHRIPHVVVLNKIDRATGSIAEMVHALASVSRLPVVLRQFPVRRDGRIVGYVDLAQGKAHLYRTGQPSEVVDVPAELTDRLAQDRQSLLEKLADFDDHLLEELLDGVEPPLDEVYHDLAVDLREDRIVPVFLTSAEAGHGVRRLLKALRHELPVLQTTLERLDLGSSAGALAGVVKTVHTPHAGKLSVVRVLAGQIRDGDTLNGERVSGVYAVNGLTPEKIAGAKAGDVVGLGKLENAATGWLLGSAGRPFAGRAAPLFTRAITLRQRGDEVKLSGALAKLHDEDPSLVSIHDPDAGLLLLKGQGEVHLTVALDRLKRRFGLDLVAQRAPVPYRETIRKGTTQHSRFKRQTGGHGAFGDATIEVRPLEAGGGFQFEDAITGGAIPRQYIPSVEAGVREGLKTGPLGFPVVDVAVKLVDGKYHTVDSSDMAFQTTGRQAIHEALPNCQPVLLEPMLHVVLHVPNDFTAKANQIVTSRRGHLLGYDARAGWTGWDSVEAHIPQSEVDDLIIELRSLTQGVGSYEAVLDHHAELTGRLADQVVQGRKAANGHAAA
jgi:elongation factor G